jgi:hypothetical protein
VVCKVKKSADVKILHLSLTASSAATPFGACLELTSYGVFPSAGFRTRSMRMNWKMFGEGAEEAIALETKRNARRA